MQLDHHRSLIDHGGARHDRCTSVVDGGTIHVDFHNESVTFVHDDVPFDDCWSCDLHKYNCSASLHDDVPFDERARCPLDDCPYDAADGCDVRDDCPSFLRDVQPGVPGQHDTHR